MAHGSTFINHIPELLLDDRDPENYEDHYLIENLEETRQNDGASAEFIQDKAREETKRKAQFERVMMSTVDQQDLNERTEAAKHLNLYHKLKEKPKSTWKKVG
jgi:hypothetical protein